LRWRLSSVAASSELLGVVGLRREVEERGGGAGGSEGWWCRGR
jgi:hypothetical protein